MRLQNDLIRQLYERYYGSLMIIACSYTRNRDDARDLVQNAFLKALLSYESRGSFLYWANKVMRNDFYNQRKRRQRLADQPVEEYALPSEEDPLAEFLHNEERRRLARMISELPDRCRDVMVESVYLGRSDGEIAAEYGLSEVNVRQIRSRAKKRLIRRKEEEDGRTG